MKKQALDVLKEQYMAIPIPPHLKFAVKKTLKKSRSNSSLAKVKWTSTLALFILFALIAGINTSPAIANALSEIPIIKTIVQVLTFREYKVDEGSFKADIKVPGIEGLENQDLAHSLNENYLAEGKALYEEFTAAMAELEANGGGHLGVDSGYVVKTDNTQILSIGRYVVNTVGSSSTRFVYDTIDKQAEILITLPSLFRNAKYIDIISTAIRMQMEEQMASDPGKLYWLPGVEGAFTPFEKIAPEQSFYINDQGKLVISFDKYEIAPGYMGVVEFIIPTDLLGDVLMSNTYIK